ncbi:hypothetical protein BCGKFG_BCGKFG_15575, partial [Dysosmobacter welbionis]
GVAQHRQGLGRLCGLICKGRDAHSGSAGEVQPRGGALPGHLVLQLQDDPLGDLLAHARRRRQALLVPGDDGHGQGLRRGGGED